MIKEKFAHKLLHETNKVQAIPIVVNPKSEVVTVEKKDGRRQFLIKTLPDVKTILYYFTDAIHREHLFLATDIQGRSNTDFLKNNYGRWIRQVNLDGNLLTGFAYDKLPLDIPKDHKLMEIFSYVSILEHQNIFSHHQFKITEGKYLVHSWHEYLSVQMKNEIGPLTRSLDSEQMWKIATAVADNYLVKTQYEVRLLDFEIRGGRCILTYWQTLKSEMFDYLIKHLKGGFQS